MKKLSKKTINLLRKVANHILEEPRRLNMGDWIDTADQGNLLPDNKGSLPPCGTQGCIAGWTAVLNNPDIKANAEGILQVPEYFYVDAEEIATKKLNLTYEQAQRLFYFKEWEVALNDAGEVVGWPLKFSEAYDKAKTALGKAKVAVRRIEHFIATNGAE